MASTRERFREQVRDEAKAVALAQLAEGGPAAVSVNAIGKALGVSGPALYRYFASRDALMDELATDAYADLAETTDGARGLTAWLTRYRGWALRQPHRYRLLFTGGADLAPAVVDAAHALMLQLVARLDAGEAVDGPLRRDLEAWAADRAGGVDPERASRAIGVWAEVHGFVSLELEGNFASMGLDGERLFRRRIDALR